MNYGGDSLEPVAENPPDEFLQSLAELKRLGSLPTPDGSPELGDALPTLDELSQAVDEFLTREIGAPDDLDPLDVNYQVIPRASRDRLLKSLEEVRAREECRAGELFEESFSDDAWSTVDLNKASHCRNQESWDDALRMIRERTPSLTIFRTLGRRGPTDWRDRRGSRRL